MSVIRSDQKLWDNIKKKIQDGESYGSPGKWNARKAQHAVQEYKKAGGTYKSKKTENSLTKWTKESWNYIDGKKGNRYLPEKIRNQLTSKEKLIENCAKKNATKRGKIKASYSPSVLKKMKKSHIL